MSKSNVFENALLLLIFNNTDITLIGDAGGLRGSVSAGSLYVSLHTGDPGEGGDQTTNETVYTNYVRKDVARTSGGWTISGNQVQNTAAVTFAQCGATGATITHFGVGASSSSTGKLLYSGATNSLAVSNGITPEFAANQITITED